jgi:hypothetical protein
MPDLLKKDGCNKTLRHDTEYDFFTEKIITLLKSPTSFTTIVPRMSFEDFLITEYCIHILDTLLGKDSSSSK